MVSNGIRHLLLAFVVSFLAAAVATPAVAHADKSFSIQSLETTAVINPDGSMDVTEAVTYEFSGGPFNFGIRSFESDLDKVVSFAASDALGTLEVIEPSSSVSGQWEWKLREPTSDTTVQFVLQYHVDNAVAVGDDVADLNWKFIGSEHPGIGSMRVVVSYPPGIPPATDATADTDTTVLRGFAHGPSNGRIAVDESTLTATVDGVPAGQFVEIRGVAPATAFTAPSDGTTKLAGILEEERNLANGQQGNADQRQWGWILTPILALLGIGGTAALWFTSGRERKSVEVLGEYWREPLDDPPAIAVSTLSRGTAPAGAIVAGTLVDLAQRGYVRIAGKREERFGPDKTVHTFHWMGKPFGTEVLQYERDLLEMVFRGATVMTSEDLTSWASAHRREAKPMLDKVTKGVKAEFTKHGYEQRLRGSRVGLLTALCTVVGIGGFLVTSALHNGIGWVAIVLSFLLFTGGLRVLMNRTQAGAEAAAKAAGLRNYLRDFSNLEEAPVGHLILWERYLVYSVALGVSAELVRGLTIKVPEVLADPNFGVWYIGAGGRLDGFDQLRLAGNATVAAAMPKNTSGGGGGFSGGSSGGGGGGGFGAR